MDTQLGNSPLLEPSFVIQLIDCFARGDEVLAVHRLENDMDAMGIHQALLYPTWFAEGFHLVEDPDVAYALARAYNDWIADFCKAAPDRLFAASMVPLQNIDFAVEELRRRLLELTNRSSQSVLPPQPAHQE